MGNFFPVIKDQSKLSNKYESSTITNKSRRFRRRSRSFGRIPGSSYLISGKETFSNTTAPSSNTIHPKTNAKNSISYNNDGIPSIPSLSTQRFVGFPRSSTVRKTKSNIHATFTNILLDGINPSSKTIKTDTKSKFEEDLSSKYIAEDETEQITSSEVPIQSISKVNKTRSLASKAKPPALSRKTLVERQLFTKLTEEALKNRHDAQILYATTYTKDLQNSSAAKFTQNYNADEHKGRLSEFMLKLVKERQKMLDERREPFIFPRKNVLEELLPPKAPKQIPIYCIDGKVLLGKPKDALIFPNSFAPANQLVETKYDRKGYRRFSTVVQVRGFEDDELFFRLCGNTLKVDAVQLKNKGDGNDEKISEVEGTNAGKTIVRAVTYFVDLPKGVYPEHLKFGRKANGNLFIQDTWKY